MRGIAHINSERIGNSSTGALAWMDGAKRGGRRTLPSRGGTHCQAANSSLDARKRLRAPPIPYTSDDSQSKSLQWCPRCQCLLKTAWHWTWQSGSKKVPRRHHGRKPRLAAPKTTVNATESAAPTKVIILIAANVVNSHSGDHEGAVDRLGRFHLRRHTKVEIK